MKKLLAPVIAIIFAASCGNYSNKTMQVIVLAESNLFNPDSVVVFLTSVSAKQADSSKKLFLNAVDLFKNKHAAEKSISFFVRSLSTYPSASAYYELGDAYLETGSAGLALKSFQMAEKLDYSPFGNVLFKEACSYAELRDEHAEDYLKYAIENGFVDRDKILNSKSLAKYQQGYNWFERVYNETMAGNGDADAVLWQGYSKQFLPAAFPVTIDSGTFKSLHQPATISFDYDKYITEMRDNKFSRDVGNEFYYFAKVADNETFKTVIYAEVPYEHFGGPAYYYMASFNNKGRLIDKKVIAGAKRFADLYKVFSMPTATEFKIDEYKNTYQNNTDKVGFENNPVLKRDLVKTTNYIIDTAGKFTEAVAQ